MAMKRTDVQQGADFPVEETKLDEVTFETASRKQNHTLLEKDHARKALVTVYSAEPKISVMVAPMYADYFGKVMHVMINGISIAVPCNGKPYDIPETFAAEVFRRLRAINEQQQRQKRYSDVSSNVENAPGELALF
jgi:hypothetical protein